MKKEDFLIQSEIRRMIVRTSINPSKIDFGSVRGVVYVRGVFEPLRPRSEAKEEELREYTVRTLMSFEKKLRSLSGVTDVIFQFLNWRKEKGQWVPLELKRKEKDEDKTEAGLQACIGGDPEGDRNPS